MNDLPNDKLNKQLSDCLLLIEEKLGWGISKSWSSRNFEQLSEKILADTGSSISSNTLKRLWGRIPYQSTPSTFTLDTLARFIDFENWSAFTAQNKYLSNADENTLPQERELSSRNRNTFYLVTVAVFGLGVALLWYAFTQAAHGSPDSSDYSFSTRKIGDGIPSSVIFNVDATAADEGAHIEIQQKWDETKRQTIDREDSLVTSVYFNPGYFEAKLVVDDKIMLEDSVLIPSNGWFAMLENDKSPFYFNTDELTNDGIVGITTKTLIDKKISVPNNELSSNYYWVQDFKTLRVNDFTLETTVKNPALYNNSCQRVHIVLLCEGEVIIIPLSIEGCMATLDLFFLDNRIGGDRNDLSKFGVNLDEWVGLRCVSDGKQLNIFINGALAYTHPFTRKFNKIYGVKYHFEGTGSIKSLKLSNSQKVFLEQGNQL